MTADGKPSGSPRREDDRLITGAGRFVADLAPPDVRHIYVLRSPVAHGRLTHLDMSDAGMAPGVELVLTGKDLAGLPPLPVSTRLDHQAIPPSVYLANDRMTYVGQPLAAVVARDRGAAEDAAAAIAFDFDPLPAVTTVESARLAPPIISEIAGNRALSGRWRQGDCDRIIDNAAHQVTVQIDHPRVAPSPLETRSCLAAFDPGKNTLLVTLASQAPHRAKASLAACLGLAPDQVRVVAPDVGGAFGMKASLYPEDVVTAYAARRLGRPVLWRADRSEDLASASHGRGMTSRATLALDGDGRMLALRAEIRCPLGTFLPFSAAVPAWNASRILPGPYDVPAIDISVDGYLTTTAPMGIYRGAGRPEAAMLMERLVAAAARQLAIDPLELRRRNLVTQDRMPHRGPAGIVLDSGDYSQMLDRTRTLAGLEHIRADQARRRAAGELVGIGMACYVEPSGIGWESARLTLRHDGTIIAATGSTAQGQGRETAAAMIVANALGLSPDIISVKTGDTDDLPDGIGALASRSTPIGGSALRRAACAFKDRVLADAARLFNADPIKLSLSDNGIEYSDRFLSWTEFAGKLTDDTGRSPIDIHERYEADGEAWGNGCYLALVSIDQDTGTLTVERLAAVDDAGTIIAPMLAEGQVVGAIAQGLGEAVMERIVYDADGQLLTGSLMDYALPRAADMPPVALATMETPAPFNALGAKGIGEAGTIGAPPAILNAALDALYPLGVTELTLPLTSESIWRAIKTATEKKDKP